MIIIKFNEKQYKGFTIRQYTQSWLIYKNTNPSQAIWEDFNLENCYRFIDNIK